MRPVDFCQLSSAGAHLIGSCKKLEIGRTISSSVVIPPSELVKQNQKPAQPPKLDIDKTSKARKHVKMVVKFKKFRDSAGCSRK